MEKLEQTVEKSFLGRIKDSLSGIKHSVVSKAAVYSLVGVLGAGLGYGCRDSRMMEPGEKEVAGETGRADAAQDRDREAVPFQEVYDGLGDAMDIKEKEEEIFSLSCPVYVDLNNQGAEDGSLAQPFNTIQEGIDYTNPNCTEVLVAPGIYKENILIDFKTVSIKSIGGAQTTIIDGQMKGPVIRASGDIVLDGFTLTKGKSGIKFEVNYSLEVKHCFIYGNGQDKCDGEEGWAGGIDFFSYGYPTAKVHNNIIAGNFGLRGGLAFGEHPLVNIENNVIMGNVGGCYAENWPGGGGVFLDNETEALVQNNIIAYNSPEGIRAYYEYTQETIQYNDIFGNLVNNYAGFANPGKGEISQDPLFVDFTDDGVWTNDDFHLQAGSPCINTGNPEPAYNDFDGTPNDLGAYGGPSGKW